MPDLLNYESSMKTYLSFSVINWLIIKTKHLIFAIDARPNYCDRGRYKVLCESSCQPLCSIDYGDAFPRYYFDFHCMLLEIEAFIKAKKQSFELVEFQCFDENRNVKTINSFP